MRAPLRTLSGLLDFECAARHASFRLAALELNKTPAAISQQIKQLEESLGFALFIRQPRQVALTEKGEQLAQTVITLLGQLRSRIITLQAQDDNAVLNVSTGHSLAMKWLVPRLHEFTKAHPDLDVRIHASDEVVSVEDGTYDIALRFSSLIGRPEQEIIYREKLVMVCCPALDPTGRWRHTPPGLEELLQFPLLYIGTPRVWLTTIAAAGLQQCQPKFGRSYSHSGLLVQAAAAGLGIAIAPSILADEDIARGQLILADHPPIASDDGYRLLFGANRGDVPKIAQFRQWIAAEMAMLQTGCETPPARRA